ncbi:MAG TPA: FtsW/RodA/SpoVE family cell cycle protein [Firmicutes bacterium]|nr:FtsW/RodA/SpoVE family cell cycle protein [Bacillota bacterium]
MIKKMLKDAGQSIKYIDKIMLTAILILIGIGLLMIYSITSISMYNGVEDSVYFVRKTVIAVLMGGFAMMFFSLISFKLLKLFGYVALLVCPPILMVTLLIGEGPAGSPVRSWIDFGFLSIQPAEFVKGGMILALAFAMTKSMSLKLYDVKKWRDFKNARHFAFSFMGILLYVLLNLILIVLQPDMGTTIIIFGIAAIMFLSSGVSIQSIGKLSFIAVLIAIPLYPLVVKGYMEERFDIWFDPFNHAKGLQNVMGYTAIALGGLFGVGIGNSTQKYGYVIEPHNDFIVTILAEELGVITVLLVMAIYFFIAMRCFLTAVKCDDKFGSLICIGVGALFLVQPVINLGGASGFIPLTGVTLPFISYGGSSMMSTLLVMGLYFNVRLYTERKLREKN